MPNCCDTYMSTKCQYHLPLQHASALYRLTCFSGGAVPSVAVIYAKPLVCFSCILLIYLALLTTFVSFSKVFPSHKKNHLDRIYNMGVSVIFPKSSNPAFVMTDAIPARKQNGRGHRVVKWRRWLFRCSSAYVLLSITARRTDTASSARAIRMILSPSIACHLS